MVIEDVTVATLLQFYKIFQVIMQEGYGQFPPELRNYFLVKDYTPTNFQYWLERNFRKMLIAKEGDEALGFIVGDHTYGGVGFISWLGVLEEQRGKGIGSQLFDAYQKYIISKKAHLIELYTYDAVKPFYEKLGFMEIGRRKQGYFGQKNVIMNKTIGTWSVNNLG